jgi:hypothetical protein
MPADDRIIGPDGFRVLAEMCPTCIFRPGNPMGLRAGRLRQITRDAVAAGSYITCHSTLAGMPGNTDPGPAICRGFADRYSTNALRVFARLGMVDVQLPPEGSDDAHEGQGDDRTGARRAERQRPTPVNRDGQQTGT